MSTKKTRKSQNNSLLTTSLSASSTNIGSFETINDIPKVEKINIEQLLAKALYRYSQEKKIDQKDKHLELTHLCSIIEEYLSCYLLIGFTLQDEQAVIFNASTSKDEGALVDLLRATFVDIINKRP